VPAAAICQAGIGTTGKKQKGLVKFESPNT